jgi:hypothetical protein
MAGYTPLFSTLTTGTLCGKWPDIGLWPIVLSMVDKHGVLDRIPRAIAGVVGLPEAEVVACMQRFEARGWIERIYPHLTWGWRLTALAELPDAPYRRPAPAEWAETRMRIFERDDFTCQYCKERGSTLECDHVMPISRGGSSDDDNLVTACKPCNQSKRNKTPAEWAR